MVEMIICSLATLEQIIILSRHGERTPMWIPSNDNIESFRPLLTESVTLENGTILTTTPLHFNESFMHLTVNGYKGMFRKGEQFREEYEQLIDAMEPEEAVLWTSEWERTELSGNAFLQGAFDTPRPFKYTVKDLSEEALCHKRIHSFAGAKKLSLTEERCENELQQKFQTNESLYEITEYILYKERINALQVNNRIKQEDTELASEACQQVAESYFNRAWHARFCNKQFSQSYMERSILAGDYVYEVLKLIEEQKHRLVYIANHDLLVAPVAELLLGPQFDCKQPELGAELIIEVHYDDPALFASAGEGNIRVRYQGNYFDFEASICGSKGPCDFQTLKSALRAFAMSSEQREFICGPE